MAPERKIGLAYVLERLHTGQWSRAYRLLCRIAWRPGSDRAWRLQPAEDWEAERMWAAYYFRLARRNPRMFER